MGCPHSAREYVSHGPCCCQLRFVNRLTAIIRELLTPNAFRDDWYGEATNQMAHALLGAIAATILCIGWNAVSGEMPYRWVGILILIAFYAAIELAQGWKSGDSWFDTLMWTCGVVSVFVPYEELQPGWPAVTVNVHMGWMLGIIGFFSAALFLRVLKRVPDAN